MRSTKREGIENLIEHMTSHDFFESPCSSQYHLCHDGGLAEHSFNVFNTMEAITITLMGEKYIFDEEFKNAIIISSLLHDLGKMGQFDKPLYIANYLVGGKRSDKKPFEINKALLNIPHEIRSIQIAEKFIRLTEEESFAICFHNALYGDLKYAYSGKETALSMLLHFADLFCARVIEEEN